MPGRIVMVSGAPGTGKTSISRILAAESACERAVHMHSDDFYEYICKGYISPWMDGAGDQNETMVASVAAAAREFSAGGYEVFVDGTIGPWFLPPWIRIADSGVDVRYIVLRPSEGITVLRAMERVQREFFPLTPEAVGEIWRSLADLGPYEPHAVDTSGQTVAESAARLRAMLEEGEFRIGEG